MELRAHIPRIVNPSARTVEGDDGTAIPDAALVRWAAGGDEEAFTLLYHRYEHAAWSLASFKLRDRGEAEDAVQETFLRAYRSLHAFRSGSVRAWLLTICRNVCMDRLRSRLARPTVALDGELEGWEPAAPAPDAEARIDLHRALAALPHDDVEAFFLVDVLGCRSHEAARIVGLRAPSTLRSRLDRARRSLADAVATDASPPVEPEVWGLLHAPPDGLIVVSDRARDEQPAAPVAAATRALAADLVAFLDELDGLIPVDRGVVALLGGVSDPALGGAAPWFADHPRWRLRVAPSRDSWLRDAERLLSGDGHAAAVAALRGASPFAWTPAP